MPSFEPILAKLEAKEFESLIGLTEDGQIDVKKSPYVFDVPRGKQELAKDVSAFANAEGGAILIGFDTAKSEERSSEFVSELCPFDFKLLDADQYRKILGDWVTPPLDSVEIRFFSLPDDEMRGYAAILVDSAKCKNLEPFLVTKILEEGNDKINGVMFGLFERRSDRIPVVSATRLQQWILNGKKSDAVDQRLQTIENGISALIDRNLSANLVPGITEAVRNERLRNARKAVERETLPSIYFMASTENSIQLPTLFNGRTDPLVRMIDDPPTLRENGFGLWTARESEIVGGKLRRSMIARDRLLELWKDGVFIFIGPGDGDFLGHAFTTGPTGPIRINNLALAESILVFCWLVRLVFKKAVPSVSAVRLSIGLLDMTRNGAPAILDPHFIPFSPAAKFSMPKTWSLRNAPDANVDVDEVSEWGKYDPEIMAGALLVKIYHWFGFSSDQVPYIERNGISIKLPAEVITGKAIPQEPTIFSQ